MTRLSILEQEPCGPLWFNIFHFFLHYHILPSTAMHNMAWHIDLCYLRSPWNGHELLLVALPCSQKREPRCGSLYGAFGHGPWGSIYMCPLISSSSSSSSVFSSVNGMTVNWCWIDVKNIPLVYSSFGLPLSCSYIYGHVSELDWLIIDGNWWSSYEGKCLHCHLGLVLNPLWSCSLQPHGFLFLYIRRCFCHGLANNWWAQMTLMVKYCGIPYFYWISTCHSLIGLLPCSI